MTRTLLDPTSERSPLQRERLARPNTLSGHVVGLLDIHKPRGDIFLDELAVLLTSAGAQMRRYQKPTFAKPAPVDLRHEIAAQCTLVIEALAD
ncbi:hypothetical protein BH10ACT2_BH10ACT2_00890 [soil metagenome]